MNKRSLIIAAICLAALLVVPLTLGVTDSTASEAPTPVTVGWVEAVAALGVIIAAGAALLGALWLVHKKTDTGVDLDPTTKHLLDGGPQPRPLGTQPAQPPAPRTEALPEYTPDDAAPANAFDAGAPNPARLPSVPMPPPLAPNGPAATADTTEVTETAGRRRGPAGPGTGSGGKRRAT